MRDPGEGEIVENAILFNNLRKHVRKIGKGKSAPKELQVLSFGVWDRIEKGELGQGYIHQTGPQVPKEFYHQPAAASILVKVGCDQISI